MKIHFRTGPNLIAQPARAVWFIPSLRAERGPRGEVGRFAPRWDALLALVLLVLLLGLVGTALAQDAGEISDDMVNAIARRMFCPVCPNEPLDTCRTDACARWREDIRAQLAAGRTEDQIIADFVARYGERASSTPLDPTLRGFSVYVPWLIAGAALIVGVFTFWRWRTARRAGDDGLAQPPVSPGAGGPADADADYRSALERDLKG